MKKKRLVTGFAFLSVLLLTTIVAHAQRTISAQVVDKATGAAISEANIHLEDASSGTTTDDKGHFSLTIKETEAGSNLVVSHIGYQTQKISVAQLSPEIQLEEQVYQIGEVSVRYVDLRKLLIKKWKVDDNSLDKVAQRTLEGMKKKDPAKYEKLAKKPDTMRDVIKLIRLVFHENGSAKIKALLFIGQSFDWQLNDDDRTIVIVDKEGHEHKQTIRELTDNHLVIKGINKDGIPFEIGYVPVN